MATVDRSQNCEYLSGLLLSDKDYQQRGWNHQYIWGLNITTHVITKMLTEQLGRQGFGLYLVEGDLYKIWAPSDFGDVRHILELCGVCCGESMLTRPQIDFATCKKASQTRAKVLKPKDALVNRL